MKRIGVVRPRTPDGDAMVIRSYAGKEFLEKDMFPPVYRVVVHDSLPLWAYTVDVTKDVDDLGVDTGKRFVRLVRWAARNDPDDKSIKYWVQRKWYNVRSLDEWAGASSVINAFYGTAKEAELPRALTKLEREELVKGRKKIALLTDENRQWKDRLDTYRTENESYRARFHDMKRNKKQYSDFLKKFKELVEDENAMETQVHDLIEEHKAFWIFGLEYTDMISEQPIPLENGGVNDYRFDILLKRQDMFWDLVELKGPNENLFDRRTPHRVKPNQKLSEAIMQVVTYLHICDTHLKNVFKPRAIIVIGNKKTDVAKQRRLFTSYLNNIEVITYTDLYQRGKALLDYISLSGKRSKK